MILSSRLSDKGFTLIELAIVLAVAGLMFAGLWRLIAGGNQQLRDQSAASLHAQVLAAIKTELTSGNSDIDTWMKNNNDGNGWTLPLPLSTYAAGSPTCVVNMPNDSGLCSLLPPGFSTSTTNAYGDTYTVQFVGNGAGNVLPTTYSFMILASGGDLIPDTSGGRIAGLIGGDGGFVYSNNVCNAQTGLGSGFSACGSYGGWAASTKTYGLKAAGGYSGSIASRTFVTPEFSSAYPWLDRYQMSGDTSYIFNH